MGEHWLTEMMDLVHYILNIVDGITINVKRTEGKKKNYKAVVKLEGPSHAQGPGRLDQVKLSAEFSLKS